MFRHPATTRSDYGRSCGCGTCAPSYGGTYGESAKKWTPDASYISTCPDYEKQYKKWLKAYSAYQALPAFLGIRTGKKVERYIADMKTAKVAGDAALAKCQGAEYQTLATTAPSGGISDEELMTIAGGGGFASSGGDSGGGVNLLIPVIGVGVLGIGGLIAYRVIQRNKAAKARAAKAASQKVTA